MAELACPPTPPFNPFIHLLDPSTSNFSEDENGYNALEAPGVDDTDLVPQQRTSIINERAVVRYFYNSTKEPVIFPNSAHKTASEEPCLEVSLLLDVTTGCGGNIWPAARVLGAYLACKRDELARRWQGKTVVELGSGTGLVGFVLAKMHLGAETWITDQDAMLHLMTKNLELNPDMDPCHVAELNWGEPLPEHVPHKPDVLLLADCVYLEVAFQPLIDTMRDLALPQTEILFCYMKRRKADKRFFTLLKKYFTFEDVQDDIPVRIQSYQREGLFLYSLRLKA